MEVAREATDAECEEGIPPVSIILFRISLRSRMSIIIDFRAWAVNVEKITVRRIEFSRIPNIMPPYKLEKVNNYIYTIIKRQG